jgi:hypothetical protein
MSDEDYGVRIKLDPGAAIPTVKEFGDALAKTETKTTATERAAVLLGKALYSLGQSMRADAVQGAAMGMRAFDGLTAALQREQAMLARIHGPARQYAEDLQVLDALLSKNTINIEQYADQVTRLNRELEKRPHQAPGGEGAASIPSARSAACRAATCLLRSPAAAWSKVRSRASRSLAARSASSRSAPRQHTSGWCSSKTRTRRSLTRRRSSPTAATRPRRSSTSSAIWRSGCTSRCAR